MDKEIEITVKDFTNILKELTFNSRPIITTLTKLAEENISCAQYFVDALESRIDKCVPNQKLYAFYALDSICKNAGSPYTIYFSKNLFMLYKKTYLIVDNNTRTKLINLFKSWLTPLKATGSPVFEKSTLDVIEKFLIKASALHQKNFQSMLPTPTIPLLLKEIDKLSVLTNERLKKSPSDMKLRSKLEVLGQLKQGLQSEKLPQSALKQVQMQLKQIFSQDQQFLQEEFRQQQQQLQLQQLQREQIHQHESQGITSSNEIGSRIPLFEKSSNGPSVSTLFGNVPSFLSPQNFAQIEKSNKLSKVQNLYESLNKENLIYTPPKESILTLYEKINKAENLESSSNLNNSRVRWPSVSMLQNILLDCKAYFANANVSLSNAPTLQLNQQNITFDNPMVKNSFIHLLYRAKPNKCSTCGKRFGNSMEERRLQGEHLDWHFRINKRIKGAQSTSSAHGTASQKNIQSRNWYLSNSQWVKFNDDDIVATKGDNITEKRTDSSNWNSPNKAHNINSETTEGSSQASDTLINEDELRKVYVVVPESMEDMTFRCPICKDKATSVYDESSGEWIWKNTIHDAGKYFHATCFYESVKNNSNQTEKVSAINNLKKLINSSF